MPPATWAARRWGRSASVAWMAGTSLACGCSMHKAHTGTAGLRVQPFQVGRQGDVGRLLLAFGLEAEQVTTDEVAEGFAHIGAAGELAQQIKGTWQEVSVVGRWQHGCRACKSKGARGAPDGKNGCPM